MLTAIDGYYDGAHIVINEKVPLQKGQRVIVTVDIDVAPERKSVNLSDFMGRGEKMFTGDVAEYVKELRENDRI